MTRVRRWAGILASTLLLAAGCGIPADPDGTLDRVRGGVLRVGVSPHEPWTQVPADGEPTGSEPDLVRRFAAELDAQITWTSGGEEPLIAALERGELELVIGGLTADTPWTSKAAITRAYTEAPDPAGEMRQHVMAAPMGENAFLLELEQFLLRESP
ncbi:MAG: transporter substrate-binding domain-containing protein [Actinomycetes bacterium]